MGHRFALVPLCPALAAGGRAKHPEAPRTQTPPVPGCTKPPSSRVDAHTPESMVPDWGAPVRIASVDSPCPGGAIKIARNGQALYFIFTTDVPDGLAPA